MADRNSSRPIPERWMLAVKVQKDGSSLSYYTCKESGQKFYTYEDLMRYVNYAKAAKLSICSPDFRPIVRHRKPKNEASISDLHQIVEISHSEDSASELASIASPELMEVTSAAHSDKHSASEKMKLENQNEGSSSNRGKAEKQKKQNIWR